MTLTYRRIDHTADLGIEIYGMSPAALFENAALALFDQIIDPVGVKGARKDHLTIHGTDWPDLMVNWLRELLYIWNGKEKLVESIDIISITENELTAKIRLDSFDPARHSIKNEIKAVTYHQIQVNQVASGWESKIIFDV